MSDPYDSSRFAYHELVQLARADGRIHETERRVLDRFAQHLGISVRKAKRYRRICRRCVAEFPEDPQRQLTLLKMLARIAFADGTLQDSERRFFERLVDDFSVSRTCLAQVLEEAETSAHRHAHIDRRWCLVVVALVVLTCAFAWNRANRKPDEMTGFKTLDGQVRPALLLVLTRFDLRHRSKPTRRMSATGTGFFVTDDGLAITNKHVLQPWRFRGKALDLIAAGYTLAADSVVTLAWPEGARVLGRKRKPIVATAFRTSDGSLQVVGLAPDAELPFGKRPEALRKDGLFCHAHDDGDLALLRCAVRAPVVAVLLAETSDDVRRLDPVLAIGYPRGLRLLEGVRAVSSPAVGRVRKIETTITTTTPLVGGNSGGPLVDRNGRVIGIATRSFGMATLAVSIRVEHARALLRKHR